MEAALERAAEVERKTYRESLQNNVEQIRMSKRLATIATDVPIEFSLEAVKAQPADPALLKAVYKELEFHSLLKELGPGEDTRARDYRVIGGRRTSCRRGWRRFRRTRRWRWRFPSRREGEFALDTIGLAWRPGEARAVTAENLAALEAVAGRCRALQDRLRREERRCWSWTAWASRRAASTTT